MKLEFDPEVDAAYLGLTDSTVEKPSEIQPGIIVDYDAEEQIIGIEILYVSKRAKPSLKKVA
jgi:uncharacterized protein YuzE